MKEDLIDCVVRFDDDEDERVAFTEGKIDVYLCGKCDQIHIQFYLRQDGDDSPVSMTVMVEAAGSYQFAEQLMNPRTIRR